MSFEPPPRRSATSTPVPPAAASSSNVDPAAAPSWKDKMKAKSSVWGKKAMDKGIALSDNIGGKVNTVAEKRFGTEAFWPVTGDFPKEMDKAARILRSFTVDGVVTEEKPAKGDVLADGTPRTKPRKVLRKIPPSVIAEAKGLAIFTSMRTGFAPFGGAGGAGVVVAKLPDGTWSAPSSISPNNLSAGLLLGVDVYDCVLVIRSQAALDSFKTHKATIGTELGVAAGPFGAGAAVEAGREKAALFSYIRSRGMYAGVEIVGQVFVERFDENAAMYHWPGVKAGDILQGKVRVPVEAAQLQQALIDAETGKAQREKGEALDLLVPEQPSDVPLSEGEVLKLPPTPDMTDGHEQESDPETERVHAEHPAIAHKLYTPSAATPASRTGLEHSAFDSTPVRQTPGAPPALPARRPPITEALSAESVYSTDSPALDAQTLRSHSKEQGASQERPFEAHDPSSVPPPPAYTSGPAVPPAQDQLDASGPEETQMTEAERREWAEYHAMQADAARTQQIDELRRGMAEQSINHKQDEESLR